LAHGISDGATGEPQGGQFKHGFVSGAISSVVSSGANALGTGPEIMIAAGGLSGGLGSWATGGSFWDGVKQGIITSALNHAMHSLIPPQDIIKVYVETDGVGHVYLEVNGTVYSYGRYDGSDSPSMGPFGVTGPGVLEKYPAGEFVKERMSKYPTDVYEFKGNGKAISQYLNKLYNSGSPSSRNPLIGRVINKYTLFSTNCSTFTCNALSKGGVILPRLVNPASWNGYSRIGFPTPANKFRNPLQGPKF
jgi:hypothetical protein